MDIVLIDSGAVLTDRKYLHFKKIEGVSIKAQQNTFIYSGQYQDEFGHGTLVGNILHDFLQKDINLFVIKIVDHTGNCNLELLIESLNYCYENLKCNIIQASLGTLYSDERLLEVVRKLNKKGVLIISAFSNEGCLSYPAAYEEVLGIDVTKKYKKVEEYEYIDNSIVNIRGADTYYRTYGLNGKKSIVHGSSFYCSYITAMIANQCHLAFDKEYVLNILKQNAVSVCKCLASAGSDRKMQIKRAIVFPFNKENHSLAAFEYLLPFEAAGYYDIRQSGKVNKRVCDVLRYSGNEKKIRNFEDIDWKEGFDTFICGHVGRISEILNEDILNDIAQKCVKYDKQLFCYDNGMGLPEKYPGLKMCFPAVNKAMVPQGRFGKLRSPNKPVVGVFGTSSQQGKMTIQLLLREAFLRKGIKVKNIGSEPEAPLFGFEFCYTFGYEAADTLNPQEMITVLNEEIYQLEKENCDLIIVGSQSGTVAHQLRNISMIPLKQYYFLLGTQPDSIILCVNAYDSVEYIRRTIAFFGAVVNAKVICICVSYLNNRSFKPPMNPISYYESIGLPVFDLQEIDICKMVQIIERYYEGEA